MSKKELTVDVLNGLTSAASLANLDKLELANKGFTSLPGLKAVPRISRLDLAANALASAEVPPVPLPSQTPLDCCP